MSMRTPLKWLRLSHLMPQSWIGFGIALVSVGLIWGGWLAGFSMQGAHSAVLSQVSLQIAQQTVNLEELQQQRQQVEQERSQMQQERDRLKNLEQSAENRLQGLEQGIRSTTTQIKDNEYRLEVANRELKFLQADLMKAEQSYQTMQQATVARLQFLQRQQGAQGWAVLLQSQDLNEFLDRRRQLKLVYQADQKLLAGLKTQAQEIKQQRANIERQKNEIALLTQQLQFQKQEYQVQAQSQAQLVTRLKSDRQALEAAEAQLTRDSQGLAELIRRKIAEQSAAQRAGDRNRVIVRGTGQLSYPVDAPITSDFGMRVHPILGYQRFHAGTDFGASHGSTIRSADAGVVIFAGWYGGYGRSVIVDHGGGLTTLYAHASELFVTEGEPVQRGQTIAAVGSTGLSTGPHLHFEVRLDGDPVDPMYYL